MKHLYIFIAAAATACILASCHSKEKTVVLDRYSVADSLYLTDGHDDRLTVQIDMEYPTELYPDSVRRLIQSDLMTQLFGEAFADMEPQQAAEAYCAMLKTEYKANILPLKEDWLSGLATNPEMAEEEYTFAAIFCEDEWLSGTVMGVVKGILSYGVERYVYTGGAHGNNFRLFVNYDLRTGRVLHEQDIFEEGFEEPLTDLLLKCMVEQNDEVDLIRDLEVAGYNVDDIRPNDNFYLADEGITFVFNPYDIAPFALGETEILIPWSDLNPILRDFVLEDHGFFLKKLF